MSADQLEHPAQRDAHPVGAVIQLVDDFVEPATVNRAPCWASYTGVLLCAYVVHIYSLMVTFEWDEDKRRANLRKHGVEFADAVTAFEDDNAMTMRDEDSEGEERFVTLATDALGRLLVVVYTWREERIRLISARKATRRERKQYEG